MNRIATFVLAALLVSACRNPQSPAAQKPAAAATSSAAGPQQQATVVTIQTVVQPENRTSTHTLVFTKERARSSDEIDAWRLFDLARNEVTFVDDIARTYRTVPYETLLAERHRNAAQPLPDDLALPHAQLVKSGERRTISGFAATENVVRLGAYQRQLWMSSDSPIPPRLFAMMLASETNSSPYAALTRSVDDALLETNGFPLLDHAELPYDKTKMLIERSVAAIEQKSVPAAMLNVPSGYQNAAPDRAVTTPAARRPAASSPPRDRSTRAAE